MRRKAYFGDCLRKWFFCAFRVIGSFILPCGPFLNIHILSRRPMLIPALITKANRVRGRGR
jgi:hypothetical protein